MFNTNVYVYVWTRRDAPRGRENEVDLIRIILEIATGFTGAFLTFLMIYQIVIGFFGFGKKKKDYQDHDPESRFLVLVPAHNEEKVIGDIIQNLQGMDYPEDLYDFYIIADNCTDHTAETARSLGAKVIETRKESPDAPTGKPIALKKALQAIGDYQNRYDLLMIFDADNVMDTNMFREVNSQYLDKGKPDFIQCYLGMKNKQGVIAWIDYTSFTLSNRFVGLAKNRLGINCGIGGTGFAMSTAYLHELGGWNTRSLTEDFEMQVEATLEGRRILWNHYTRVYDEKPTTLKATVRQKIRWGQGRWYVTFHQTRNLFRAAFAGKISVWEFMSVLTNMYIGGVYVFALLQSVLTGLLCLVDPTRKFFTFSPAQLIFGVAFFTYGFLYLFCYADRMDNGIRFSWKSLPVTLGAYVLNLYVGFVSQVYGLIRYRDQHHWAKTEHGLHAQNDHQQAQQLRHKAA